MKFQKGHTPWHKGTKGLITNGKKGTHQSKEHIEKLRLKRIGRKPWNKGLKCPGKHSSTSFKKGLVPWNKGLCGEKSHSFKTGTSRIGEIIKGMPEYEQWRSNVFSRDEWTCQTCRAKGVYLNAHHIKSKATIIIENKIKNRDQARNCSQLWDVNNGVTLCEPCHKLTDNYLTKGRIYGN
jgi:hypothetical protein